MSVSFCPAGKSSSTAAGTSIVLPEPGGAVTTTAPLREAADAVHFDTSKLSFEESEQALLNLIQEKLK